MITKGTLRKLVREILAMTPGYGHTEAMLHRAVNERVPGEVNLTSLREAREWNHGEEYLRAAKNPDTDEWEYFITKKGIAQEAVR